MPREYYITFEENGGEYSGHITFITDEPVSIVKRDESRHYNGVIRIGKLVLILDEAIESAGFLTPLGNYVDITTELERV